MSSGHPVVTYLVLGDYARNVRRDANRRNSAGGPEDSTCKKLLDEEFVMEEKDSTWEKFFNERSTMNLTTISSEGPAIDS